MDNRNFFYRLTLGHFISEKESKELLLEQSKRIQFDDKEKKVSYYVTLLGVKVNRKIYQPTEIEAEIDFMQKTTDSTEDEKTQAPSFEAVSDLLLKRTAKLEIAHRKDENKLDSDYAYTIAENCYVFELNPQLKRDVNGVKMSVRLNIFSMDKLMTLNKYSKAYVASKLGSGILKPESLTFGKEFESETPLIKTNIKGMRFLKYEEQFIVPGDNGKQTVTTIPSEFIQPYLVQYNESFYDFLVRTANRCGEFLYFEDGELTLGLPDSGDPFVINDFESVTAQSVTAAPLNIPMYARDSAKEGKGEPKHMNYTPEEKKGDGFPKHTFPENTSYNSELATDEYIFPLYKGKATDLARETMYDGVDRAAIFKLTKIMKNYAATTKKELGTVIDAAVVKLGVTDAVQTGFAAIEEYNVNKKLREKFFDPMKGNSEQCDGDKMVQFGTLSEKGWTTLNYYSDVRQHEEKQMKEIVCINMSTNFYPLKLGQKITIAGSTKTYVVIQIIQSSDGKWKNDYDTYDGGTVGRTDDQRSMKVFAIPSYTDVNKNECFIPPVQPVPVVRKSGPQTAFIIDSNDPKYQGRVRIAYPWQSLGTQVQVRLEAANASLQEAQNQQKSISLETERLRKEHLLLLKEKEDLELPEAEREARRKELEAEISELEKSIQNRKRAIKDASDAVEEKERAIADLPANTENRESTLREMEEDKQLLILHKHDVIEENEPKISEEEQELERKKAHFQELKAVEDKSQQESIIRKKQGDIDKAADDLKEMEMKKKGAEKDVEEKQKEYDKAKVDEDKKLKSVATPWVRVATPVATEGGGFYYVPREGDEVLVNFDNDNVERPYVVGQLYSKETLDPRERMNRKMSLKGLGTMALVSPNGHHIAFSDPGDGGGIVGSIVPAIGVVNKIQGWIGPGIPVVTDIIKPKALKDLTGGIHIGDRYGLYEISMSSDGRKININSPLGEVNLNAFTGISIKAVNGDVKIEGKNVSIEASNKLTIHSGTNIGTGPGMGKIDYRWAWSRHAILHDAWAALHAFGHEVLVPGIGEIGKEVYKQFPITNLSLIRNLTQVYLRPVDGTMLIKSNKYMLLEAGRGKAMVKADRFKEGKTDDFFLVYKTMIFCVGEIQNKLQQFFTDYASLYKNAVTLKNNYDGGRKNIFANEPDILALAYGLDVNTKWDKQTKKITDAYAAPNVFATTAKKDEKELEVAYAFALAGAIYNLKKHVESFKDVFADVKTIKDAHGVVPKPPKPKDAAKGGGGGGAGAPAGGAVAAAAAANPDYSEWVLGALLDTFADDGVLKKLMDAWKKEYGLDTATRPNEKFLKKSFPEDRFATEPTAFMREVAAKFILKVSRSDDNKNNKKFNKYIYIGYDEKDLFRWGSEKLKEEFYWKRFIKDMDRYIQNSVAWRTFLMSWVDKFYTEQKRKPETWGTKKAIWDKEKHGQILMSDNEDYTLNIVKDGIKSEDIANQFNLDRLKKKLYEVNFNK